MLETVDFSREPLSKDAYKARRDELMERLVVLQQQARVQGVGLVVLFEGWNGAGKGSRISDLMYHLDARATSVYVTENLDVKAARAFAGAKSGVTGFYPVMQEFWKSLGQRGTISFFDRGWYTAAVQHMLYTEFGKLSLKASKRKGQKAVAAAMAEARDERHIDVLRRYLTSASDFERQLADDGYLVVKFFVHVTKEAQKKRLTRLHDDPATRWRVGEDKLATIGNYEEAYRLYDNLLKGSDFSFAPWHLVNGEDKRRANLQIAETLVNALTSAFEAAPDAEAAVAAAKAQANSAGALDEAPLFGRSPEEEARVREEAEAAAAAASARAPRVSRFRQVDDVPRERRPRARARPRDVQGRAQGPAGAPQQAGDGDVPEAHPAHDHVRRLGRRGQGRQHQARGPSARRPRLYHFSQSRPHEARAAASAPVALLDASAEGGPRGHLRPQLVRSRARGARRRFRFGVGMDAGVRRDQRIRARSGAVGRHPAEVLG